MIFEIILFVVTVGVLLLAFFEWATANREYFSKRGIKHLESTFLVGNTIGFFLKRYSPPEFTDSIYYRYPKEKCDQFFKIYNN